MSLCAWDDLPRAEAIVAAVAHREYLEMGEEALAAKLVEGGVFADVKSSYEQTTLRSAGVRVWRL